MSCMAGPSADEEKSRDIIASTGYNCYSDASSNGNPNIQTHLQNFGPTGPEMYNLSTSMENMIGFPSKNLHHDQNGSVSWKGFFTNTKPGPSSSKEINHESEFYNQHDLTELLVVHEDPSSLRSCVFPCEGNERPSHGLSLSLSSSNPSNIGLQSFELRQQHNDLLRFGPSSSRSNVDIIQQHAYYIRSSRYLGPAQELLSEFCNLGTKQNDDNTNSKMKAIQTNIECQDSENAIKKQSLYSLDLLELQRRKTKLLQMLEEVDRRYKHYCNQMKGVISSFESVAGNGAATSYSALASKAMSRHFRCLKDGILSQIKATKKAMGEKDTGAGTLVKGETPRLRLLDQTLRQQRALQQMGNNMEIHPWRPQRGLPERSVSVLRAWLFEHFLHPYPSDVDKHILARQTGLSRSQVSNWFINARVRLWKPMVEEMYLEELKEDQAPNDVAFNLDGNDGVQNHNPSDQKPTHDQLARIDSECLSSIINNPDKKNKALQNHEQHFGRLAAGDSFGAMGFDFSSYGSHSASAGATRYGGGHGVAGGGGVSLTLGLHQHGASGGMNLPFSQSSLFYPRDHQIEDCQTVQYSLLDGESQNLPYRNLMGAQLLRDLAG